MSNIRTKEYVQALLDGTIILPNPIRTNSQEEEDILRQRKETLLAEVDKIETVETQPKRFKPTSDQPIDETSDIDLMATDASATVSPLLTPSPSRREPPEVEETRQQEQSSLIIQEQMHFTNSHSSTLYPPKAVVTMTAEEQGNESDDDKSAMDQSAGEFASPNPFAALAADPSALAGRQNYILPPPATKKDLRAAKEALLERKAAEMETKRVKQASRTEANRRKLTEKFDALDPAAGITVALSQTTIAPTPEEETVPIFIEYRDFSDITTEIVVGPLRLHIQISKNLSILDGLLKTAGKLRTIRSIEDARCEIQNHVASDLRFEVRLDPSSVNMDNTSGPQNDCGFRAEFQGYEASVNKTVDHIKAKGRSRADSAFKKDDLFPYLLTKAKNRQYAFSEAGLIDKRVIAVLANDASRLASNLQYTTDRLAVDTKTLGFMATLFARVGPSFRLVSSTHLFDSMSPADTTSQQARKSANDPTLPQLRRMLQDGSVIAFIPSTQVATLEELQLSHGIGHFAWQTAKTLAPFDTWQDLTVQITSCIMQILLRSNDLEHIANLVKEQAYQALLYAPPLPSMGPPASLFIHNFPAEMTASSPDMRDLVLSEVLLINDLHDLGIDTTLCEAKILAGTWIGGLDVKKVTKDKKDLVVTSSYGMAFPLLQDAPLGCTSGRIRECTGAERSPILNERSSPAKFSTTYMASRLASSHVSKLSSPNWANMVCVVRVCSGDTGKSDMSTVQIAAVRSYFHINYQCNVILVAYSFTHKINEGRAKRFLPEVAMLVILEEEGEFSLRTQIRNDLFGPTTKHTSVIKTHGGVELELAQSSHVLLTQPPTQGPNGPRTLACTHMRCLISPDITREDLATLLTETLPPHFSKGLFLLPIKEPDQEFADWVITVSPLFTSTLMEAFQDTLQGWLLLRPPTEREPLLPYIELHLTLEAFGLYEYYSRREVAKPPSKPLPSLKKGLTDTGRNSGSRGSVTSTARTTKSGGTMPTKAASQSLSKLAKPKLTSVQAARADLHSPTSSLNTSTTSTVMVTMEYVEAIAETYFAKTVAYTTDRLEKSEAETEKKVARQEAQMLLQAEQLQTTTGTISALKEDFRASEERATSSDLENKLALATITTQQGQLNNTVVTMAALMAASERREEERALERAQDKLRQERNDELQRQSLELLARLTAQSNAHVPGGSAGQQPHNPSS